MLGERKRFSVVKKVKGVVVAVAVFAACSMSVVAPATGWAEQTDTSVEQAYQDGSDTGASKLSSFVAGASSVGDGTIRGVDLTSYQAEREAGVTYRDFDGNTVDDAGFMQLLKESGVNSVMLKIAVDPTDGNGNSYGGGAPTLDHAVQTAVLAKQAGLKVNAQFLFSDFHTSKAEQLLPKNWSADVEPLKVQVPTYLKDSIARFEEAGAVPDMITLGNEIQDTFLGQSDWQNIATLMKAGVAQVRASAPQAEIVLGFANVTPAWITTYLDMMKYYDVDYDAIGTRVYPVYDSLDDLAQSRQIVSEQYGKKLLVLGLLYPFTPYDSDGYLGDSSADDLVKQGLEVSPQGQASYVRRVFKAIVAEGNNDGAGVFYGDAAWIAVKAGSWYWTENDIASNKYGTGWITKAASDYSANAQYANNNNQDQMALFDDLGQPLQSLKMFGQLAAVNSSDTDLIPESGDPYATGADTGATKLPASIQPVQTVTADTIRGADVSSYQALYNVGVRFKNDDGQEESLFKILKDHGINWVRLRLYVDPYDSEGHAYGSGVCDLPIVTQMAREATDNGQKVLLDLHYNDFNASSWRIPKAWNGHSYEQLKKDMYSYTKNVMNTMKQAGVELGMVQIGNESNSGLLGVTLGDHGQSYAQDSNWPKVVALMNEGARAIRESMPSAKVAAHFMYTDSGTLRSALAQFRKYDLDYDVFGMTYYPFWSSGSDSTDAMKDPMGALAKCEKVVTEEFGKEFAVVEFSYPYTEKDSDGQANNVGGPDADKNQYPYDLSPQGQADVIHDTLQTVTAAGSKGLGAFWWEPAWIGVVPGNNHWQVNKTYANDHATGWASSYAKSIDLTTTEYDQWGGSGWDNQSLFDSRGYPLQSLKAFEQVVGGTKPAFSDVTAQTPHATEIRWLASAGITTGYDDGTFQPFGNVTRWQMAAFMYRLAGSPDYTPTDEDKARFSDVDENSTPFAKEIMWMGSTGVSTGYADGTYRPDDEVTRADMAAFLRRLSNLSFDKASSSWEPTAVQKKVFSDVKRTTPHAQDIWWLAAKGVSTGFDDGTFAPYNLVTRADMAAFLYRLTNLPSYSPTNNDRMRFSDVDAGTPHNTEVWWLASAGITTGYDDGTFQPFGNVTRWQMAAFMYRLAGSPDYTPTDEDKARFSDVDENSTPFAKEIMWMGSTGVSTGYADGTYRPDDEVTRADMAAFLRRLYDHLTDGGSKDWKPTDAAKAHFIDVAATTAHADDVWWLGAQGISTGYDDGRYGPDTSINRCDMAAFLYRLSIRAERLNS